MEKATSKQLLNEITQQIQALPSASQTQAGQTNQDVLDPATIQSINGIFELLSTNYGNQFYSAFPSTEQSNTAKRLWAKHLNKYPQDVLMAVADEIVGKETFLPSLAKFKEYCDNAYSLFGLPDVHSAYVEACRAPNPKKEYKWSHLAVYYAGLATDWFFISSAVESKVLPVFKRNYEMICDRVIKGEELATPLHKALPEEVSIPLDKKANLSHLKKLRESMDL